MNVDLSGAEWFKSSRSQEARSALKWPGSEKAWWGCATRKTRLARRWSSLLASGKHSPQGVQDGEFTRQ